MSKFYYIETMLNIEQKFEQNLNSLLNKQYNNKLAVAVSGGADSVALLILLFNLQTKQKEKSEIIILTVNHHLREEANIECEYVLALAKKLNCQAIKFDWDAQGNLSNLQSRARGARYDLMTKYCFENNIPILLTAHHQDDNIENYLIRKKRKSGIFGLSSANIHNMNNIKIIRPLFNIFKTELVNYLLLNNIKWFEDSSNFSDKYLRGTIRQFLALQNEEFKQNIIHKQQEIDHKAKELRIPLNKAFKNSCNIYQYGFAMIDLNRFANFEYIIKFQLLSYIITIIGGQVVTPRARILYPIIQLLNEKQDFIRTLHGTSVKKIGNSLLIYRLFGKKFPAMNINPDQGTLWDNRFKMQNNNLLLKNTCITHLSFSDYLIIKDKIDLKNLKNLSCRNHQAILFTLPVLKTLEKIIAIPHISFYNNSNLQSQIILSFRPKYISRFINIADENGFS